MSRVATKTEQLDEVDRWSVLVMRMRRARMPLWAMEELVAAFEHGVKKHGAGDYLTYYKGKELEPLNKARRHIEACVWRMPNASESVAWLGIDEESGVAHMAKAAADLLIGIEVAHVA